MTDSGPRLEREDLEKLERTLGASLPRSYKRFLLKHNGGKPEPRYFKSSVLTNFLSVGVVDELNDVAAFHRFMQKRKWLPAELMPIAWDPFGDVICLAMKGKNRGKVYFWDHEGASERVDIRAKFPEIAWKPYGPDDPRPKVKDDWPGHPDLTLIADSFDEFLDSFHDVDEAELKAAAKPRVRKGIGTPAKRDASRKQVTKGKAASAKQSVKGKTQPAAKPGTATKPAAEKKKPAAGAAKKPATSKQTPRARRSK